jgi:hypothetical protein
MDFNNLRNLIKIFLNLQDYLQKITILKKLIISIELLFKSLKM